MKKNRSILSNLFELQECIVLNFLLTHIPITTENQLRHYLKK